MITITIMIQENTELDQTETRIDFGDLTKATPRENARLEKIQSPLMAVFAQGAEVVAMSSNAGMEKLAEVSRAHVIAKRGRN